MDLLYEINMPQATLSFNLPEESAEHLDAISGSKWKLIISDFLAELRSRIKYQTSEYSAAEIQFMENTRKWIFDRMAEDGLLID